MVEIQNDWTENALVDWKMRNEPTDKWKKNWIRWTEWKKRWVELANETPTWWNDMIWIECEKYNTQNTKRYPSQLRFCVRLCQNSNAESDHHFRSILVEKNAKNHSFYKLSLLMWFRNTKCILHKSSVILYICLNCGDGNTKIRPTNKHNKIYIWKMMTRDTYT